MIIQVQFGFNQIDNFFKKNCHLRFPINVKKKKKKNPNRVLYSICLVVVAILDFRLIDTKNTNFVSTIK